MPLRFHRSIKLGGLRINLSKRGVGLSAGFRGLRVGVDARGRRYTSASIPGTGLSVREFEKPHRATAAQPEANQARPGGRPALAVIVLVVVFLLCILVAITAGRP